MSSNVQATPSYFYQELQTLLCENQTLSQGIQFIPKEKKKLLRSFYFVPGTWVSIEFSERNKM